MAIVAKYRTSYLELNNTESRTVYIYTCRLVSQLNTKLRRHFQFGNKGIFQGRACARPVDQHKTHSLLVKSHKKKQVEPRVCGRDLRKDFKFAPVAEIKRFMSNVIALLQF